MLRIVRRLPVEYLRTLTGLRLGAGILQPLTTPVIQAINVNVRLGIHEEAAVFLKRYV
jgi:hypothetical protein